VANVSRGIFDAERQQRLVRPQQLLPRTGYADVEGRARTERAPAVLHDPAGVWYDEIASLPAPVAGAGRRRRETGRLGHRLR
jgi:hypothetical protein